MKERLNGYYSVEILENGLTENEAETRKGELMAKVRSSACELAKIPPWV